MGACYSSKPKKHQVSLQDISYRSVMSPTLVKTPLLEMKPYELTMRITINSIKARNLPKCYAFAKMEIPGFIDKRTEVVGLTDDPETIFNAENNLSFGKVEVNLFDAAIGPISHDLALISSETNALTNSRVSFDLRIVQRIRIVYKVDKIMFCLDESLKEKDYNFSVQLVSHHEVIDTEQSDLFHNPFYPQRQKVVPNKPGGITMPVPPNITGQQDEGSSPEISPRKRIKIVDRKIGQSEDENEDEGTAQKLKTNTNKHHVKTPFHTEFTDRKSNVELAEEHEKNQSNDLVPTVKDPKRHVSWDFNLPNTTPPLLDIEMYYDDFALGSVHLCLWSFLQEVLTGKHEDLDLNPEEEELIIREHKLVGECYIATSVFIEDPEILLINHKHEGNVRPRISSKPVRTKLWYQGISIGNVTSGYLLRLDSYLAPLLLQLALGVRTEDGIKSTTGLWLLREEKLKSILGATFPREIKSLVSLRENQNEQLYKLFTQKNFETKFKMFDDIKGNVTKMKEALLEKGDLPRQFIYQNTDDLLKAQVAFIDLAEHLLQYADNVPGAIKGEYYNLLVMVFDRPEFDLLNMGFDEKYAQLQKNARDLTFSTSNLEASSTANPDLKNFKEKLKIGVSYHALLIKALERALQKLSNKGIESYERRFIEFIKTLAFFRIPAFQEKFLHVIDGENDVNIDEWHTEFTLEHHSVNYYVSCPKGSKTVYEILFDWEKGFNQYLGSDERSGDNFRKLDEILNDPSAMNKHTLRGGSFFSFLKEWAEYVFRAMVTKYDVPWLEIPGYRKLINGFLSELRKREVHNYPEGMISASATLLFNEQLLNSFITILYKKTNTYDSLKVFRTYELIDLWLKTLELSCKKIPSSFDFDFFFQGIFMVIETEHAICIAQVLVIIYNHFHSFPDENKRKFVDYFFSSKVYKLSLHWSYSVRRVCHHLLLYRFFHLHRNRNFAGDSIRSVKKELILSENSKEKTIRKQLINDYILTEVEKVFDTMQKAFEEAVLKRTLKEDFLRKTKHTQNKMLIRKMLPEKLRSDSLFTQPSTERILNFPDGPSEYIEKLVEPVAAHSYQQLELSPSPPIVRPRKGTEDAITPQKDVFESPNREKRIIRVNKRMTYYPVSGKENEIPKCCLAYVMQAWPEFKTYREEYEKWATDTQEKEKDDLFAGESPRIPEIKINIPLDLAESSTIPGQN